MSRRFLESVLDADTEKNRVEVRVREKDKGGVGDEGVDEVGGVSLALEGGEGETVELGEV